MITVLWLLAAQCVFGAVDNFWHHEIRECLPAKRSARHELRLHAAREFIYGIVFLGLAWRQWHGIWAWVLVGLLLAEVVITLADFVEEDRSRTLPRSERVLHTILAVNYGVWLGVFAPQLLAWAGAETAFVPVDYGWLSGALTLAAIGVFVWAARNTVAVIAFSRPPEWLRTPIWIGKNEKPRTVLVSGATGFIGTALVRSLIGRGDNVIVWARDPDKALNNFGPLVRVVAALEQIDSATRIDSIVNLAGAPTLALPWFGWRRAVLLHSRLETTAELVRLCARLDRAPASFISASAIGFYGVRNEERCDESTSPREQFQSTLCQRWEAAAQAVKRLGVRVVSLRLGLVLGAQGGALPAMAMPVRRRMGAILGSGRQWVSWIHVEDVVRLIQFSMDRPAMNGAVNAVAPQAVRHAEFQTALASQLRRRIRLRIPAALLRTFCGEMSQLLVDGQHVVSHKLRERNFEFRFPTLAVALRAIYPRDPGYVQNEPAHVYFNGQCPVCNAEMTRYGKISRRHAMNLCFVDSVGPPDAFADYGLRVEHLEERLYVRDAQGRIHSGLDAVLFVWRYLSLSKPLYGWAARVVSLPIVYALSDALYDVVVAPSLAAWARRRQAMQARSNLA